MMILTRKPVTREQYIRGLMDAFHETRESAEKTADMHILLDQVNLIPDDGGRG
ncbi:hypothetical protein [Corynebacterium kalidii]|uniref:Uncharacterized protein n=1 Tax=Corynebacterium kalidii TaxID=2931982 RepID=A0A9X1WML3_9CORY|nr:hypothetical protein [Corynebacterium kalidii]MCJ7857791.1 hypothetical protein [Corynebacterium kalidii]